MPLDPPETPGVINAYAGNTYMDGREAYRKNEIARMFGGGFDGEYYGISPELAAQIDLAWERPGQMERQIRQYYEGRQLAYDQNTRAAALKAMGARTGLAESNVAAVQRAGAEGQAAMRQQAARAMSNNFGRAAAMGVGAGSGGASASLRQGAIDLGRGLADFNRQQINEVQQARAQAAEARLQELEFARGAGSNDGDYAAILGSKRYGAPKG